MYKYGDREEISPNAEAAKDQWDTYVPEIPNKWCIIANKTLKGEFSRELHGLLLDSAEEACENFRYLHTNLHRKSKDDYPSMGVLCLCIKIQKMVRKVTCIPVCKSGGIAFSWKRVSRAITRLLMAVEMGRERRE